MGDLPVAAQAIAVDIVRLTLGEAVLFASVEDPEAIRQEVPLFDQAQFGRAWPRGGLQVQHCDRAEPRERQPEGKGADPSRLPGPEDIEHLQPLVKPGHGFSAALFSPGPPALGKGIGEGPVPVREKQRCGLAGGAPAEAREAEVVGKGTRAAEIRSEEAFHCAGAVAEHRTADLIVLCQGLPPGVENLQAQPRCGEMEKRDRAVDAVRERPAAQSLAIYIIYVNTFMYTYEFHLVVMAGRIAE